MDEELVREIQKYSEIPVVPQNTYEVPQTIQNYKERIKANECGSVFDSDFYTLYNRLDDTTNGDNDMPFQNEPIFKVSSGRGRGIMSKKFLPGGYSDDNDIKKDLRKIAPLGYSNEVTELTLNSKKMGKSQKKTQSASMGKEKLENTSSPSISQILQDSKKKRDSAYRAFLIQKEQQMWNETVATEKKIKELLEEDRQAYQQFCTDLEKRYDDLVTTDQRTSVNSDFPWGKGYSNSSKLNLKSTTDFPPLSNRKNM